jgi:UDP-N-acetylmuramate: L-alanyl-gamma-D-glutamyl-meso-diaminopimelate ligase
MLTGLSHPIKHIHLIGICGTAMASLAGMLQTKGFQITGSDQNIYPPMSTFLEDRGIGLCEGFSEGHLEPRPDLVVVGNAVSRGNPEVESILNRKIHYVSMAEVLKEFFIRGKQSLVVVGTHGKTTTASLLAWFLECGGMDPSFLVGGIAENFGSSFKLGSGDFFVIEGDEYDTAFFDKGPKFLHYLPDWVIFNNCEFDHADIYSDFAAVQLSFRRLINIIPSRGKLFAGWDDPVVRELSARASCAVQPFGLDSTAQWTARSIEILPEVMQFEVWRDGTFWERFETRLTGTFNVKNAIAAIACAEELGVGRKTLQQALSDFKNVKRRLEICGVVNDIAVFDDFAHHPTAIRETLSAVKARYPNNRLWAIFEPRSATSRRNVFQHEFARCFLPADRVVLCSPFAPEKLDASLRLDVQQVVSDLKRQGVSAGWSDSADAIVAEVAPQLETGDRVVIMSNGGFDGIHRKVLEALRQRYA